MDFQISCLCGGSFPCSSITFFLGNRQITCDCICIHCKQFRTDQSSVSIEACYKINWRPFGYQIQIAQTSSVYLSDFDFSIVPTVKGIAFFFCGQKRNTVLYRIGIRILMDSAICVVCNGICFRGEFRIYSHTVGNRCIKKRICGKWFLPSILIPIPSVERITFLTRILGHSNGFMPRSVNRGKVLAINDEI